MAGLILDTRACGPDCFHVVALDKTGAICAEAVLKFWELQRLLIESVTVLGVPGTAPSSWTLLPRAPENRRSCQTLAGECGIGVAADHAGKRIVMFVDAARTPIETVILDTAAHGIWFDRACDLLAIKPTQLHEMAVAA
ncbi:MAG: hypothetical protein AB7U62_19905 [Pseudolabrys sp.]